MYGLAQGEQSTLANPHLYLCCRWMEHLQDLVSGTFQIDQVLGGGSALVNRVASTSFVASTHKLGTGRYVIPTGSTASWNVGTHRVTCRFVMSVGGPTHVAVFEFELLDPVEWITGTQYHGLVSTRRMYDESFIGAGTTRQALHRYIDQWSRDVEEKLGRIFGARYLTINVAGRDTPVLLLPEAILCTDQVQAVWKDTSGEEVTFAYDDQYYRVYNRHLDGKIPGEDDRYNPKLEVTGWTDPVAILGSFQWPWGRQNIQISGVWGFTDPEPHASGERVPLGKIPPEVQRVVATLVSRSIEDPTMSNPTVWSPGSIREYKTRDQSIKLGSGSGMTVAPDSPTGDPYLDRLLLRFAKPVTSDYSGKEHADL